MTVGKAALVTEPVATSKAGVQRGWAWLNGHVGGPARLRVVAVLAAVLALDGADTGTVSAAAGNLESAFGIGTTRIGLLVTASTLVGAACTIPVERSPIACAALAYWR